MSAGGVVLNLHGQVLVVNQRGRSWSLPKGHVEAGEELEQAARREIAEESGITDLTLVRPLGSYVRPKIAKNGGDDELEMKTLHFFLFTTRQMELRPTDADNPEARWVDPPAVAGLLTHARDKSFFTSILPALHPAG